MRDIARTKKKICEFQKIFIHKNKSTSHAVSRTQQDWQEEIMLRRRFAMPPEVVPPSGKWYRRVLEADIAC